MFCVIVSRSGEENETKTEGDKERERERKKKKMNGRKKGIEDDK